ncbi:MAG: cyclase family protein [Candidatus Brocadiia bacterium]
MKLEQVCRWLTNGRIVDLTKKASPGNAEGPVGTGKRKYEIREFRYPPGEIMHFIDMESHISTHVEAPSHFVPVLHGRPAHDVSEVALDRFFGMAVLVDCKDLAPKTPIGAAVLRQAQVRQDDIVLIGKCPHPGENRCYMARDGVEYLLEKKIKLVGVDDTVFPENPQVLGKEIEKYYLHDLLLSNEIPIIEALSSLDQLRKTRFLFFAFPARMGGLESFPVRAVAIEGD